MARRAKRAPAPIEDEADGDENPLETLEDVKDLLFALLLIASCAKCGGTGGSKGSCKCRVFARDLLLSLDGSGDVDEDDEDEVDDRR